jgi:hypothetical protein
MNAIVDSLQDIVPAEVESEQPGTTPPDDGVIESQLTQEITTLWSNHVRLAADRKLTSKELRKIRTNLAERLYEMKAPLSSRARRPMAWMAARA